MEAIKERLPDWAKDLRLNLGQIERVETLGEQALWGTVLACAQATRSAELLRLVEPLARQHLSDEARRAARAAAGVMGMNNVYYRFVHLASNAEYGSLPARLRMQALANPGVPAADFELWCLAVSAVNGCGKCLDSHEAKLRAEGVDAARIQDAVRVASILAGVAQVLDAEAALAPAAS